MYIFDVFTVLLVLAAVFSYLNTRFKAFPPTIGFMVGSLLMSLILLLLKYLGFHFADSFIERVSGVDFGMTVLYGILSFLLFAGSLQFEIRDMAEEKWVIFTLATAGVVISTFVVGILIYWIFPWFKIPISLLSALIFGALISPTDPVVVIGTLKRSEASKSIKMQIIGEALFNDGIAIILFVVLTSIANFEMTLSVGSIVRILFLQLSGSLLLGIIVGWLIHFLVFDVTNLNTRILITLGCVSGGYDTAMALGISGPITIVIAGLFFRNYKMHTPEARDSLKPLYYFWTLLDEFLNAILFILMGLEILHLSIYPVQSIAGIVAIAVVLAARYISVWLPMNCFSFKPFSKKELFLLTWAGLRGGISLAMALTLPEGPITDAIRCSTYIVVLFSTLIQGLTFKKLAIKP